jgi:hypothetical protein
VLSIVLALHVLYALAATSLDRRFLPSPIKGEGEESRYNNAP